MSNFCAFGIDPASTRNLGLAFVSIDNRKFSLEFHDTVILPDFDTNGWSLAQWRGLFKDGRFEIMTYEEQRKDAQIIYDERLAEDMPTIRKVVPSDDELQVSAILVRLVKK